ncbi:MAG: hypothetical protein ACI4EH_03855 [Oliverpabstia sp.]
MEDNFFLKDENQLSLKQYINYHEGGRMNLGDSMPIAVYRMLEYSVREQLEEQFGKQEYHWSAQFLLLHKLAFQER